MRIWTILILITFEAHALSLGGVDVGNRKTVLTSFDTPAFKTEFNLQIHAEEIIFPIKEGTHPKVFEMAMLAECSIEGVQIRGLSVEKFFPINFEKKYFKRRYKGQYIIELFDCKRPDLLKIAELSSFN